MLVADDVCGVERGQNAHLVQRVFLLLVRKVVHLHFLQRVNLRVRYPLHLVNAGVGPLSQFGDNHEVFQRHTNPNYYIYYVLYHTTMEDQHMAGIMKTVITVRSLLQRSSGFSK